MSNTGIADNSVGGNVSNSAPNFDNSSTAQAGATTDYGRGGPSAGLGNNVEKDYGERKEQGGVKGVMNKITDKLNPSHDKPVQQEGLSKEQASLGGAGDPTRQKQTYRDLNRE